jgi:hypothetical protein
MRKGDAMVERFKDMTFGLLCEECRTYSHCGRRIYSEVENLIGKRLKTENGIGSMV